MWNTYLVLKLITCKILKFDFIELYIILEVQGIVI